MKKGPRLDVSSLNLDFLIHVEMFSLICNHLLIFFSYKYHFFSFFSFFFFSIIGFTKIKFHSSLIFFSYSHIFIPS